jgi:hypothetical protein
MELVPTLNLRRALLALAPELVELRLLVLLSEQEKVGCQEAQVREILESMAIFKLT